jgi:hypothetical protein
MEATAELVICSGANQKGVPFSRVIRVRLSQAVPKSHSFKTNPPLIIKILNKHNRLHSIIKTD